MPTNLLGHTPETLIATLVAQIDGAEIMGHEIVGNCLAHFDGKFVGRGGHARLLHEGKCVPVHFHYAEPGQCSPEAHPTPL